jgi:hypothetical protein
MEILFPLDKIMCYSQIEMGIRVKNVIFVRKNIGLLVVTMEE